jgi:hypothetical protein
MSRLPKICPWCLVWLSGSLRSHLLSKAHENHPEYKKYKDMYLNDKALCSKEMARLNVLGRVRNNIRAITKKDRPIVPARRTNDATKHVTRLVWCSLCKKALSIKAYREKHLTSCARSYDLDMNSATQKKLVKEATPLMEPERVTMARILEDEDEDFKEVLLNVRLERLAVTQFVCKDRVARALLSRMASNGKNKTNWISDARMRLRILFEYLKFFKAHFGDEVQSILDMMRYSLWHKPLNPTGTKSMLVEGCLEICKYNPKEHTFQKYNEVMTISSVLQHTSDIIENQLHHEDDVLERVTRDGIRLFHFLRSDSWKVYTVRVAARQKALQINFKKEMVPLEDFQFYLNLAEEKSRESFWNLQMAWLAKEKEKCLVAHKQLVKVLPLAIGTFCYRRVSEPFAFTRNDFVTRANLDKLTTSHEHLLTDKSIDEIGKVFLLESRGKGDNPIFSVIKMEWLPAFELLCDPEFRAFVGVPLGNKYVFGLGSGKGFANPSKCQADLAKECIGHVSNHMILRSRYFRMTFASNLGAMNLTYESKKLLCALLGHTLEVHEKHYNLPQPLKMAAYIGYICQASADDKIKDMHTETIESKLLDELKKPQTSGASKETVLTKDEQTK